MVIDHHVDTVYVLLSACCHLLLAICRKAVHGWLMTCSVWSAFRIFCISFNTAKITSHGMHLSSHLSLVLYFLDSFLIFNGITIKDILVINSITCQMPIRGKMMSESTFSRSILQWDSNHCLPVTIISPCNQIRSKFSFNTNWSIIIPNYPSEKKYREKTRENTP